MTCRLQWCGRIETRCRIPIWRTFGRIQWHVIPEPPATLQGAATWWIHCHDSRATCHIAGCKNSIRHIENGFFAIFYFFLFLMQFRLWRAAAFVSSPTHLFSSVYPLFAGHSQVYTQRTIIDEEINCIHDMQKLCKSSHNLLNISSLLNWSTYHITCTLMYYQQ